MEKTKKVLGCVCLVERTEIAKAMNFGKYPVLWMEIGKSKSGWDGQVYEGCRAKVRWNYHGEDLFSDGELAMYVDEQEKGMEKMPQYWDHLHLTSAGTCLKADFGYSDVMDNLDKANSPEIKVNQEVIVVFKDSVRKVCYVRKMVTGGHFDKFCGTMLTIDNPKEAA